MPQFSFRAFDGQGKDQAGSIDAASANDAVRQLAARGLFVQNIEAGPTSSSPVSTPARPTVQPSTQPVSQPRSSGIATTTPPTINRVSPGSASKPTTSRLPVKTAILKDHELYLLMAQFSNLFRGGITPVEACQTLAQRQSFTPALRAALTEMSRRCAAGDSLADAMEVFVEMFPPGTVGAVRAGETGGYLWQACEYVSAQTQATWKLRRMNNWVSLAFWSTLMMFPIVGIMQSGFKGLFAPLAGTAAPDDAARLYLEGLRGGLFGLFGFLTLSVLIVWIFGPKFFGRRRYLPLRHKLGATMPVVGRRAKLENARALSYHLGRLQEAGLSPYRSWKLASEAVPNLTFSNRMKEAGTPMTESSKLSAAMRTSEILPGEYADLVQTGEMTGTVPQAMAQVMSLAEQDQAHAETAIKIKAWIWVAILVVGVGGIAFALFYRGFYEEAFKAIFAGTGME